MAREELANAAGKKPNWSQIMDSDNPMDIYGLSAAEADNLQFIGFSGKDIDGNNTDTIIAVYNGTDAPTLTNYADLPIGAIIIAPKLTTPKLFIHNAQSSPAVVGDWFGITAVQET